MMLSVLSFLLCTLPLALADVEFTTPQAGSHVAAGTIDVEWRESGLQPPIKDLTAYTLVLMVGGNDESNQLALTTFQTEGNFGSGNSASGTIPNGIAGAVPNGFFFKIVASAIEGGTVINYSDRFSITGLTGVTQPDYRNAVEALGGSTDGPPRDVSVPGITASASTISTTATSIVLPTSSVSPAKNTVTVTAGAKSHSLGPKNSLAHPVLDTGALAGIIVAIVVLVAFFALGLWALIRRKRRQGAGLVQLDDQGGASNRDLRQQPSTTALSELGTDGYVAEMAEVSRPPEMDSMTVRAELAGDFVHDPQEMDAMSIATTLHSPVTPLSAVMPLSRPMTPLNGNESPVTPVSRI